MTLGRKLQMYEFDKDLRGVSEVGEILPQYLEKEVLIDMGLWNNLLLVYLGTNRIIILEKNTIKKVVNLEFFNSSIWKLNVDENKEKNYNPY